MSKVLSFRVEQQDEGMRIDALLGKLGCYPSRSAAAHAIQGGLVFLNGATPSKKYLVSTNDFVVYEIEDKVVSDIIGQPIPLDIRFEDDDLLVLSKQIGLVCHPSAKHADGTLVNALIFHCGADKLCDVQGDNDRLGIVHRLDKDTSGLMLAAKSNDAGEALMADIKARFVDRRYLALVHGIISPNSGLIDAPVMRSVHDRIKMCVSTASQAREAITTFNVLERFEANHDDNGYTLVACKLFTGRTHQIRVHMEYIKHPIVGDTAYCSNAPKNPKAALGLERQFLHSYRLSFTHPITLRNIEFVDNLPRSLASALDLLADRSMGRTQAGDLAFEELRSAPHPQCKD